MPATFPASQAEGWADALTLRPGGDSDPEVAGVPSFALLEMHGPDPRALLFSTLILAALVSLSIVLGRIPSVTRAPESATVTLLVAPPEPLSDISSMKNSIEGSARSLPAPKPVAAKPPSSEMTKSQSALHKAEELTADLAVPKPVPPEVAEKPAPIPIQPERVAASVAPIAAPVAPEAPKPKPAPLLAVSGHADVGRDLKAAPAAPGLPRVAAADVPKTTPNSLGGLPLSQLSCAGAAKRWNGLYGKKFLPRRSGAMSPSPSSVRCV